MYRAHSGTEAAQAAFKGLSVMTRSFRIVAVRQFFRQAVFLEEGTMLAAKPAFHTPIGYFFDYPLCFV